MKTTSMGRTERLEDSALKPVGFALAAVVAGLGGAHAEAEAPASPALEPPVASRGFAVDDTMDPAREEDPRLILGPSAPVEPFAAPATPRQGNLFDL